MSLIHKALERANATIHTAAAERKIHEEARRLRDREHLADEEKQLSAVEKEVDRQQKMVEMTNLSRNIIIGIVIGALLAGSWTLVQWMTSFQKTEEVQSVSEPVKKSVVALPTIKETRALPEKTSKPKYQLSGITTSGGEKMALINNQIVQSGTRLDKGPMVKSIQEKTVILEDRGKEIVLSL